MTKLVKLLLLSVFAFLVLSVGWVWHRTAALGRAFGQVQRRDSPARVTELFNQAPYVTTNKETAINWDETWADKTSGIKCVRQFHFCPPFSICGESWIVGFDEHSNVVSKYHVVSP